MYQPSKEILKKYADVLVKFALWNGKGIRPGDIVCIAIPDCAKPLLDPLIVSILESGGNFFLDYRPNHTDMSGRSKAFFITATLEQAAYIPKAYMLERVNTADHIILIEAQNDVHALDGVDTKKIMALQSAGGFYRDARDAKELAGKQSWTIALYGTESMAANVGLTLEEYWDEIIKSCFLDQADPVARWKEVNARNEEVIAKIHALDIAELRMEGPDVSLRLSPGENRKWLHGRGNNIPSFEVFTSPDWRTVNGWIRFTEPLSRYGTVIEGIFLEFKEGKVVRATAEKNQKLLEDMIAIENMDKVGEFSLTDRRQSMIRRRMGTTLFDENIGGDFGNTHIALGRSFHECYQGDPKKLNESDWESLGYNKSPEHVDIISTSDRSVTAVLENGEQRILYQDGQFIL